MFMVVTGMQDLWKREVEVLIHEIYFAVLGLILK